MLLAGAACAATAAARSTGPAVFETSWLGYDSGLYTTARHPWAAVVADLNGDGKPDVATANWPNLPRVTVLLNNGDGSLAQPSVHPVALASLDVVAADFDGDNDLDLLASNSGVNYEGNSVALLRNNGNGTYQPAQSISVGAGSLGPVGLAAADFDDDGDQDVAVARFGSFGNGNTIALLRNNGNGTFAAPLPYPAGAAPYKLVAADLNGDRRPDLAVANEQHKMHVLLNDGAGGFLAPVPHTTSGSGVGFYPCVAATDVDKDGDTDVLYSRSGVSTAVLYRNNGNGTFAPGQSFTLPGGGAVSLALADVTGDGWADLLAAHDVNEVWSMVPGGPGGFAGGKFYISGQYPAEARAADMDGDGDFDAVIANKYSLEVCVHFNPGDGNFNPPPSYPIPSFIADLDAGDMDGDGDADIAVAYAKLASITGGVAILKNAGDGTFGPAIDYPAPSHAKEVRLTDLTDDGLPDLLWVEDAPPYNFMTRLNNGDGSFGPIQTWIVTTCGSCEIDAGDFDNDGDKDVVVVECLGCVSIPLSSRRLFIAQNVGTPTSPSFTLHTIIVVDVGPASVALADYNKDGKLDIAVDSTPVDVLLGNGDLTFNLIAVGGGGLDIATHDLNNDGNLDLAMGTGLGGGPQHALGVMLGNGDGTFSPQQQYIGAFSPDLSQITQVQLGDADGDGDVDAMASNYASNSVSFWENKGDGTFLPHVRHGIGAGPVDLCMADFDGNGLGDLAAPVNTVAPLSGRMAVMLAAGAPCIPSDINCDGKVDQQDLGILLASYGLCQGQPGFIAAADIDKDGCVGQSDLGILLANWTG